MTIAEARPAERRGSPRRFAAPALLLLVLLLGLPWLTHPWFDATNDGAMYLLSARSLLEGEGYAIGGVPFIIRPPGFPLLLAPVLALVGTDFHALNLLGGALGALGVLFVFLWARPRLGSLLAGTLALTVWFAPSLRTLCNQLLSDVPGMAAFFGLLLVARWSAAGAAGAGTWRRDVVLGLALGLCAYVRWVLLLLLPAIALSRLVGGGSVPRRARLRRLALVIGCIALVATPWVLRNQVQAPTPPADQTRHYSYGSAMWHTDTGDPGSPPVKLDTVLARIPGNGRQLIEALGTRLVPRAATTGTLLLGALLSLAVVVRLGLSCGRAEGAGVAELACVALAATVLISFRWDARHVLPLFVVALACAAQLLRDLLSRLRLPRPQLLAALPLSLLCALDWQPRPNWLRIEARHALLAETSASIDARVAPNARLGSTHAWYYAAFLQRPVYNLHFAVERSGRADVVEEIIDKYDLDTVVLSRKLNRVPALLAYFEEHYGAEFEDDLAVLKVRQR